MAFNKHILHTGWLPDHCSQPKKIPPFLCLSCKAASHFLTSKIGGNWAMKFWFFIRTRRVLCNKCWRALEESSRCHTAGLAPSAAPGNSTDASQSHPDCCPQQRQTTATVYYFDIIVLMSACPRALHSKHLCVIMSLEESSSCKSKISFRH